MGYGPPGSYLKVPVPGPGCRPNPQKAFKEEEEPGPVNVPVLMAPWRPAESQAQRDCGGEEATLPHPAACPPPSQPLLPPLLLPLLFL